MQDARIRVAMLVLVGAVASGCASAPDPLAPVRQRVAAAAADGAVRTYAAGSLADAQRNLKLAADAGEGAEGDHFIYMTGKNLDIAAAIVERREAEQELAALRAQPRPEAHDRPEQKDQGAVTAEPLDPPKPAEPSRNVALTIPDLSFDSGTAVLSPGAKRRLDPVVASLRGDPALNALIEGYTDNSGAHEANLRISLSRAQAVKDYLVEQGVAAARIQTLGHGEQYPIASNATAEGRSQNRRIEIVVHRVEAPAKQDARRP